MVGLAFVTASAGRVAVGWRQRGWSQPVHVFGVASAQWQLLWLVAVGALLRGMGGRAFDPTTWLTKSCGISPWASGYGGRCAYDTGIAKVLITVLAQSSTRWHKRP